MATSRLFEQLQKAAVARAAMSPPPAPPPQTIAQADDMARDIAALQAEADAAAVRAQNIVAEEAMVAIRAAAERERAEIEARLAAQQGQRLAELEREVREAEEARLGAEEGATAPVDATQRYPVMRGFAVVAVLAALILGWYFVPWRTPTADPERAKVPPALKMDPNLDLGRPK